MRQQLRVVTDAIGTPHAEVPCSCMWDLVEYLSYQRTAVTYRFEVMSFTVTFLRQEVDGAQQILDEWAMSPPQMLQSA